MINQTNDTAAGMNDPRSAKTRRIHWNVFLQSIVMASACFLAFLATTQIANAYNILGKWPSASANYRFDGTVPTGAFRDRINNGSYAWTAVSTSPFVWYADILSSINDVRYGSMDGAYYNVASTSFNYCGSTTSPKTLCEIDMKFDSAEAWYTSTGTTPSNQVDLWGIAAHEFGHASGFDHADQYGTVAACPGAPSNTLRATMCTTYGYGCFCQSKTGPLDRRKEAKMVSVNSIVRNIVLGCAIGALVAFGWISYQVARPSENDAQSQSISASLTRFSIVAIPWEQTNSQADVVVEGKIQAVSQTAWNQDSGDLWGSSIEEAKSGSGDEQAQSGVFALPYYTIEVKVDRVILGDAKPGDVLTFTVLGNSPYDPLNGGPVDERYIAKGSSVLAYGTYRPMPWKGEGERKVLMVTGGIPNRGFLMGQPDGTFTGELVEDKPMSLDAITAQIMTDRDAIETDATR